MTEADGDGEALRVPPWLPRGEPPGDEPEPVPPAGTLRGPAPEHADPHDVSPERDTPSWDIFESEEAEAGDRERQPADAGRRRMLLLFIAAGLVVTAIFVVGALRTGNGTDRRGGGAVGVTYTGSAPPAEASPAPSGSAAPSPTATPPESLTPTVAKPPPPVRYGPVTIEAEDPANTLGGSARVAKYPDSSGGEIVRNIGDWDTSDGDGVLRFEDVDVPVAGTYTLKVFHVNLDNERTRTAIVTVGGESPVSLTINGSSACCSVSGILVQLRKGRNTITIANPDGHAPSMDRIELSLP
jgi:hypothetical protein